MKKVVMSVFICFLMAACQQQQANNVAQLPKLHTVQYASFENISALTRIAFGSCNRQNLPQPLWESIVRYQPDLWIWLGDNVYANTRNASGFAKKYNQQLANEQYRNFVAQVPKIGIWDDHDYGANNGNRHFRDKTIAQHYFLEFMQLPKSHPARKREGIYQQYVFGEPGRQVKVILLDTRYFRDKPGEDSTILGSIQWQWLREQLQKSQAQVHLIASGNQIIPTEHKYEKWQNYPKERQRLLDLLVEYDVANPIFLTGDRHFSEISQLQHRGKRIYEVTSSGMTHPFASLRNEPNKHRVGRFVNVINYASIEFNWQQQEPHILLQLRNAANEVLEQRQVRINK